MINNLAPGLDVAISAAHNGLPDAPVGTRGGASGSASTTKEGVSGRDVEAARRPKSRRPGTTGVRSAI